MATAKYIKKWNLSRTSSIGIGLLVFLTLIGGYLYYSRLMANASVSGNKFLTANGSAVGTASVSAGGFANTTTTANDGTYLTLREASNSATGLSWNFTGWNALNTATEATGDKVTKVVVNMSAGVGNNTFGSDGNKTFQFRMYNFNSTTYDLITTATRNLTSRNATAFTLSFPSPQNYTNYFDAGGNFRIQMENTADGDGITTYMRIDYVYVQIYYDKKTPAAAWNSPNGNPAAYYTNAASVVLKADGNDNTPAGDTEQTGIASMRFYSNNGSETLLGSQPTFDAGGNAITGGTWSYTWSPAEGSYTVYARAYDGKNNASSNTASQTIVVDRTSPTAAFTAPSAGNYVSGATYSVTGTANDTNINNYTLEYSNGGPWTQINQVTNTNVSNGALGSWSLPADGTYSLRLTVTDKVANPASVTTVNNVYVDNNAPTVSITAPSAGDFVGGAVYAITGTASDTFLNYYKVERSPAGAGTWTLIGAVYSPVSNNTLVNWDTTSVANGNYDLRLTAYDKSGKSSSVTKTNIQVDNTLPTASITDPANGSRFKGATYDIIGTANDANISKYRVEYSNGGPWNLIEEKLTTNVNNNKLTTWTLPADGTYTVRLSVYDKAGNLSTGSVSVTVDSTAPGLDVEYYSDAGLTTPVPTSGGKPLIKSGTVYVKLVPNETLRNNPGDNQITIAAPGTTNSVTNADFTWTGSAWRYTWTVNPDTDGDATVTVKGTDLVGNVRAMGAPGSGGTVNLNVIILNPSLSYTIENEQLILSWSVEDDHKEYRIYRSTSNGFTPDGSTYVATVAAPAESYTSSIPAGVFYYKIIVEDIAGNTVTSSQITVFMAAGPTNGYVKYFDKTPFVGIAVYWDDTLGGSISWADNVVPSGAALSWRSDGLTFGNLLTTNAYAVLSNAEKFKNYYFKINKGGRNAIIRAFPVTIPYTGADGGTRSFNDYAHGNFRPDSPMCGGCHSTHSALKAQLLKQATYYDLCLFCHGTAATQSKYDVQRGKVFTGTAWVDSLAGPIGSDFGTSKHNVDDRSNVDTTVYGSAPGKILTFTCVSCHKGHGGPNDNYRLIRDTIYPSNDKFVSARVYYNAFSIVKNPAVGEEVYMVSGNTEFCSACHLDYDEGSAWYAGGTYSSYRRHPVTVGSRVYSVYRTDPLRNWYPAASDTLPLQVYSAGESIGADKRTAVVCSTCHYAHGTYKSFSMDYPQSNGVVAYVYNQKMLRLNNYGVCESCHKK